MRNINKLIIVVLVVAILPIAVSAQSKPRITSPSDRSSSVLGSDINVYVSGNSIEVIYSGLTGNPNPSNSNEGNFYKGTMYQSGTKFFFTPNTSAWENKWVKIIAHDKVGGGWSDPVYVKINPKPQPGPTPPPAQPTSQTQTINADRWTNTNTTVYNDWNPNTRRTIKTINTGTKVYVSAKYTLSNGEVLAKIPDGYVNANNLNTAAPTPTYTTQPINADRWTNASTTVYNDWNPSTRRVVKTININTKVYVSTKYTLGNGEVFAKIPDGFIDANSLRTAASTGEIVAINPEPRYINQEMREDFAAYANGPAITPDGSVSFTGSVQAGTNGVSAGVSATNANGQKLGDRIPVGEKVYYYPKAKYGNTATKYQYDTEKNYIYYRNGVPQVEKNAVVLIQWGASYYYIPRKYLRE